MTKSQTTIKSEFVNKVNYALRKYNYTATEYIANTCLVYGTGDREELITRTIIDVIEDIGTVISISMFNINGRNRIAILCDEKIDKNLIVR